MRWADLPATAGRGIDHGRVHLCGEGAEGHHAGQLEQIWHQPDGQASRKARQLTGKMPAKAPRGLSSRVFMKAVDGGLLAARPREA
jgi:hypothetical protein